MKRRCSYFLKLLVAFSTLALTSITSSQTQSPPPDQPRLKNFGQSLKKTKEAPPPTRGDTNSGRGADVDVIRVQTDLVVSNVLVVDNTGKAILGLDRKEFVITEDGEPQEIGLFSLGDAESVPRSIVLIMDYSGSQLPYIKTSVDAAKKLVDKLSPKDKMALVTDDVELVLDFTSNKELLQQRLELLKQNALSRRFGKSLQYNALMATLKEMFTEEDIRPLVIFQTDGDQLRFLKEFKLKNVIDTVERSRATIYTIIPGSLIGLTEEQRLLRIAEERKVSSTDARFITWQRDILMELAHRTLREHVTIANLAKLSGGWPDSLDKPEQADEVYGRIFADITHRYIIGYYPTNKERPGQRRNVQIEVRGHPEYIVWGRKTYFAPNSNP